MGGAKLVYYLLRKPVFREYHFSDTIKSPIIITPHYIELGERVYIAHHGRIEGVSVYNGDEFTPIIKICDGVTIQQNIHLTCANRVTIEKNTAIAANVTITDIHHPYDDINVPIERQRLEVKEVVIGEDCKIYNNSVILPGVHIGKHVTIGASSVVACDIPDYSVAAGSPARIIKKYDFEKEEWKKIII